MALDRLEHISQIYDAASQVAEEERSSFLEQACQGDAELRREVEALLAYEEKAKRFIDKPALQVTAEKLAHELAQSLIGRQIGHYKIVSSIGAGGMGEVYRATDTRLNRTVALKVLPKRLSERADARQRFEREAHAIAGLNHPNICALYDIGRHDEIDFLVMEYLEGETLSKRLKKGPLPTEQVLRIAIEIATALDQAHRRGVIHRDLKPGNIMLTKSGAKLLDFGLAKQSAVAGLVEAGPGTAVPHTRPTESLTEEGTILGTLEYMAPEQVEGKEMDSRTDIFALGVVIYEMASGRKAFEGESRASLTAAILTHEPPPITTIQPMTPPALERVVRGCLAKDPDERWQSARDLVKELKWIADGHTGAAEAAVVKMHRTRRVWLAWAVALVLVALTGGLVANTYFRQPSPKAGVVRFTIPFPSKEDREVNPVISPDGEKLAISNGASIWIRPLKSEETRLLAEANTTDLFWSPDSRFIAYWELADNKATLRKVEVAGEFRKTVCVLSRDPESSGSSGTWNRDGTILFPRWEKPMGLSRVSAEGGTPEPVTTVDESRQETTHFSPYFLPDGRHFLYGILGTKPGLSGIYLGSIDSPTTKQLLDAFPYPDSYNSEPFVYAQPGFILYRRQGQALARPFDAQSLRFTGFPVPLENNADSPSVSNTGTLCYGNSVSSNVSPSGITKFDRRGKEVEVIGPMGNYFDIDLSPDATRLAIEEVRPDKMEGDISILDLGRGNKTQLTEPVPAEWNYSPVWSPDGTQILFSSNRDKGSGQPDSSIGNLYLKASNGEGNETAFLKSNQFKLIQDWSRDGRYILYAGLSQTPGIPTALWVVPLVGERKPSLFLQSASHGQFSPNGRWVAYAEPFASNVERKMNIYVRAFPSGDAKWQVSPSGGVAPKWRGDGKELFYWTEDRKLMSVEVKTGTGFQFSSPEALFEVVGFDPGISTGRQKYAVSPDGKFFYVLVRKTPPSGKAEIHVVMNWTAELEQK